MDSIVGNLNGGMTMEHMNTRWVVVMEKQAWQIITDESDPWYIFEAAHCLPGDPDGKLTAQAICDAHNASIANTGVRGGATASGTPYPGQPG